MYTLFKFLAGKTIILNQLPILILSMIIAELFYKFHSFTLECLAFLVTWFAIDAMDKFLSSLFGKSSTTHKSKRL